MSSHTKGSSSPRVGRRMVARAGSGGDVIVRTGDAAVSAPRTKSKKVGKHSYPAGAKRGGIAAARSNSTESRAPLPAAKTYGVGNGPPRSMPKKWVASSKRGKTIKASDNSVNNSVPPFTVPLLIFVLAAGVNSRVRCNSWTALETMLPVVYLCMLTTVRYNADVIAFFRPFKLRGRQRCGSISTVTCSNLGLMVRVYAYRQPQLPAGFR